MARQSGGRSLFAAKDVAEPIKAGAPLVKGYRTADFAYLEWAAPDNGGLPITGYKLYRGTASGQLSLLSAVDGSGRFVDSAPPSGTAYYRVTALNGTGESVMGNELALAVGDNAPTPELACTLPGLKTAVDTTGEAEAIAPLFRDIEEMYVAEPEDMLGKVVVSLRISQAAPQQGGNDFYLWFDSSTLKDRTWRARIGSDAMPLQFWDGTTRPTDDTLDTQRVYTSAGVLEEGSGFTSDGFVRFVLDKKKLGLATGDKLLAVNGRSLPATRTNNILTEEAGYFDYTRVGNDYCTRGGIVLPPITPGPVTPPPGSGPVTPPSGSSNSIIGGFGKFGGGGLGALLLLPMLAAAALRRRRH